MRCCVVLLALAVCVGCDAGVSEEDLGTVHYEMPQVPGTETPYKLPEQEASAASNDADHQEHDDHDHPH